MDEQRIGQWHGGQGEARVAPVFRLLGEGRLGAEAVDAVMAVLEAEGLPTVAEASISRAAQIACRPRPLAAPCEAAGVGSAIRRLVATLVLDLRPWALPAGVRGRAAPGCRLLFSVDQYEVVLQESITAKRQGRDVVGQVLRNGDPVPWAPVVLAGPGQRVETEADDDGSFRFRDVGGGTFQLDVWAGDDLIVCTPVELDRRRA